MLVSLSFHLLLNAKKAQLLNSHLALELCMVSWFVSSEEVGDSPGFPPLKAHQFTCLLQ